MRELRLESTKVICWVAQSGWQEVLKGCVWTWSRNWGSAVGLPYKIQWAGRDFCFLPPSWTTTTDSLRNTSGAQKSPSDPSSFKETSTSIFRNVFCPPKHCEICCSMSFLLWVFFAWHTWMFVGARLEEYRWISLQVNALTDGDIIYLFLSYPK